MLMMANRLKGEYNMDKKWRHDDIEAITEDEARELAEDALPFKGHTLYFVDFGGYFKYSCLVFADGHHIHYANDYELHHPGKTDRKELHDWYIEAMGYKLFTEEEIAGPVSDYDEYQRKQYFIRNYYGMRRDRLSIFGVKEDYEEKKSKYPYYSYVSFAYYDDKEFVEHLDELLTALNRSKDAATSFDYWVSAFKSEMANHEYCVTYDDSEVLSCFGIIPVGRVSSDGSMDIPGFTKLQQEAYAKAREEYLSWYKS